jgi:hypothetical protein
MNLGFGSNPYLGQQAQAIQNQANQNLQTNILPGINSGATAAGQYGGSRQGIAQGQAIGLAQQGVSNSLANLYGNAYAQDQALQNQYNIAQMGNDTSRANALTGANASMYGADKSSAASMYGSDQSAAASRYGADASSNASRYGADTSRDIAGMNNATTQAGQQLNYQLGLGQNQIGQQNANTNLYGTMGNLYNNAQANQNSYNLGLGTLGLNSTIADQNFYSTNRGQDLTQMQLGANMLGQGVTGSAGLGQGVYNAANTAYQAPQTALNNYSNVLSQYSGMGGAQTTTQSGSPVANAAGGALAGAQIANNLGFGGTSYTPQNSALMSMYGNNTATAQPYQYGTFNNPSAY